MTQEAIEILQAAAEADGLIMHTQTFGGTSIDAGGKSLIPSEASHRTVQMWVGGLQDLENESYIRQTDVEGNMFELTREGYFKADELKEERQE